MGELIISRSMDIIDCIEIILLWNISMDTHLEYFN